MPKKAQLPPGAAGRSQQTLARRNRRDALGKWPKRDAGVAAVAVLAWAAKTAWPRARRKLFPRKPSRRASRAKTAAAIETTAEAAAEWAVVQARADAAVARGAPHEAISLYRDAIQLAPALSPACSRIRASSISNSRVWAVRSAPSTSASISATAVSVSPVSNFSAARIAEVLGIGEGH